MGVLSSLGEVWSGNLAARILITFGVLFCVSVSSSYLTLLVNFLKPELHPRVAIRNVYFHPLSKFPGPKLWAATQIAFIISLLRGNMIKDQIRIHQKYGDVARLGPNEISFAKEEAWHDIYMYRPGHKDVPKNKIWYIAPNDMPQNIVTTTDPVVRARMRKLLSNSFTEKALQNQQPVIESYADLLIKRLRDLASASGTEGNGVVVDMVDWVNFFTVDVIGDLAMGESFDCLKNSDYHPWVRTLSNFIKGMVLATATRFYPTFEYLFLKMLPKSVMEAQRNHTEFTTARIHRRLNLKFDRPDFMTPFMKDNANFENMSLGEIESTFAIIIVAGSETTATTTCGTLNHIVQNASVQQKLVAEIRSAFKTEGDITIESTKDLPYLNAVIKEGLRRCNPVPGGLARVAPKGGDTFAGHWIPENTAISVRPFVITHSETYFAEPFSFIPERWLPERQRPAQFDSDHRSASNPFSVGPAGCLGKSLAWAEMRLLISRLLWAFDIAEEEGKSLDWDSLKSMMIVQKEPMELRIKAREATFKKNAQD